MVALAHILLLTSDSDEGAALEVNVQAAGYPLQVAHGLDAALEALDEHAAPLIIVDARSIQMSPETVCATLSASTSPAPYLLAITQDGSESHVQSWLLAGADEYLASPVDTVDLRHRLLIARKRLEARDGLRETEEQLRILEAAIDSASEGVLITQANLDPPGPTIIYANPGMSRMTSYTIDDMLGENPRMFQGPDTNRGMLKHLRAALEAGESFTAETVNYRKDGTGYNVRWNIAPVRDPDGAVTHYVSVQQDVSEQRRLEHELVNISDREQTRIGRDLHDSLGQQLTALAFMARTLEAKLEGDFPESARQADMLATLTDEAKDTMRRISRGLLTVNLDGEGLSLALETLARDLTAQVAMDVRATCDPDVRLADESTAIQLYRIGQEAMTNSIRHSKGSHLTVLLKQQGDHLLLRVEDDGVGHSGAPGPGLGLNIMAHRARMINASLTVRPGEQRGTVVECSLPLVTLPQETIT